MKTLRNFAKIEDGATAIEYSLILTLIAVALFGAFDILGNNILKIFDYINASLPTI